MAIVKGVTAAVADFTSAWTLAKVAVLLSGLPARGMLETTLQALTPVTCLHPSFEGNSPVTAVPAAAILAFASPSSVGWGASPQPGKSPMPCQT
jgi:hypothetical protein